MHLVTSSIISIHIITIFPMIIFDNTPLPFTILQSDFRNKIEPFLEVCQINCTEHKILALSKNGLYKSFNSFQSAFFKHCKYDSPQSPKWLRYFSEVSSALCWAQRWKVGVQDYIIQKTWLHYLIVMPLLESKSRSDEASPLIAHPEVK